MFLSNDLYKKVLIDPILKRGKKNLTVVAGFGYPAMAYHHLKELEETNFNLKLVIGMGVKKRDQQGFVKIENNFKDRFGCYVLPSGSKTHSKIYQWEDKSGGKEIFIGSANYSKNALFDSYQQNEILYKVEDGYLPGIESYINDLNNNALPISDSIIEESDSIFREYEASEIDPDLPFGACIDLPPRDGLNGIRQCLLKRDGSLPGISGLNWGQRPGREPNQAYIKMSADLQRKNFFPITKGEHFLVQDINDENFIFIGATAGTGSVTNDDGTRSPKQIESHEDNSILGKYFRKKLNVVYDSFVTKDDLLKYGKTYVDFYKINDETYLMDF